MADLEHRHLRSAIEFAVTIAAEGQKRRPPVASPPALRPFFSKPRIPNNALGRLRRIIEGAPDFRSALAAGAVPELVDEIGRLWLAQPSGWEERAVALAAEVDQRAAERNDGHGAKRAERRRAAAEQAAARARLEVTDLRALVDSQSDEIDLLRADLVKAEEAVSEMRTELIDVRVEIRHARDREAAAAAKVDRLTEELAEARAGRGDAEAVRDDILAARVEAEQRTAELAAAAEAARRLAEQLEALVPSPDSDAVARPQRPPRRTPMALPGGLISTSADAAGHLVRSDAAVLIDGYNVAKLAWPGRPLADQRRMLLDAVENLARRHGTDVTVVFDGASVVGSHADRRRLARVVYSPEGVIADDVIRDETRRLPTNRKIVVVTDDAEIVRDVRAEGANVVPSNAFLAIL